MSSYLQDDPDGPGPEDADLLDDEEELAFCPSCNGEMSPLADRCPHCGDYVRPTAQPARRPLWGRLAVLLAILALAIGLILMLFG